jgi:hypothetical protein
MGLGHMLLYCTTGHTIYACYYIGPEFIHSHSSPTIPNNKLLIKKICYLLLAVMAKQAHLLDGEEVCVVTSIFTFRQ